MGKPFYEFFSPVKVIAGHKALEHIPFELEGLGSKRPLLITDQGVTSAGLIKHVRKVFQGSSSVLGGIFDEVPPDSSINLVKRIASQYRDERCDGIIAVGGGSVLDTAKGVNILVSENGKDLHDFLGAGILQRPLGPFIAVPTTAGTGSEATLVAVIADEAQGRKLLFTSYFLMPDAAVLDSRMTLTLPPAVTAATAMDALTHAVEAFTCLGKNPLSDAYAAAAVKLIARHCISVVKSPKDKDGRLALAEAATMAGIAFSNSMVGLVHTVGHSVGSVCHVPHGTAMSVLLPHVLRYNLEGTGREYRDKLGELLLYFTDAEMFRDVKRDDFADSFLGRVNSLRDELYQLTGLPKTLKQTGSVRPEDLPKIAQTAMGDASGIYNPKEFGYDDVLTLLKQAYE